MLRKLGLTIAYLVAVVYVLSIVLPAEYCLRHGCRGPGELDAFMPAFMLTPAGAVATAFCLRSCLQQNRKKSLPWLFWPLAILFAIVLLGVAVLIGWIVYQTAVHRR